MPRAKEKILVYGTRPVMALDIVNFTISGLLFFIMAVCVVLILRNRRWPPVRAKIPFLTIVPAASGIIWWLGMASWTGIWPNFYCMSSAINGIGISLMIGGVFERQYRYYRIFVSHRRQLWPAWAHIGLLVLATNWIVPVDMITSTWDPELLRCTPANDWVNLAFLPGYIAVVACWFYFSYKLRSVRQQFNEYRSVVFLSTFTLLQLLIFPIFNGIVFGSFGGGGNKPLGGALLMLQASTSTFTLFMTTAGPLVYHFLRGDKEYLHRFTHGMTTLPDPSLLDEKLSRQLYDPNLLSVFRQFAGERFATELVDFYAAVVEREATTDYFDRQAASMEIIDRFLRPGSPQCINISDRLRRDALNADINRIDAFDKVKRDVFRTLVANFENDFKQSTHREQIRARLKREASELDVLRSFGLTDVEMAKDPQPGVSGVLTSVNSSTVDHVT